MNKFNTTIHFAERLEERFSAPARLWRWIVKEMMYYGAAKEAGSSLYYWPKLDMMVVVRNNHLITCIPANDDKRKHFTRDMVSELDLHSTTYTKPFNQEKYYRSELSAVRMSCGLDKSVSVSAGHVFKDNKW